MNIAITKRIFAVTRIDDEFREVERVSAPSLTEFLRIVQAGAPVIITDAMNHWPARQTWKQLSDLLVYPLCVYIAWFRVIILNSHVIPYVHVDIMLTLAPAAS